MPSIVWKLMTKDRAKEEAKCTLCNSIFRHKTGASTTNLMKHLKTRHPMTLQFHQDKDKQPGKLNVEARAEKRCLETKEQSSVDDIQCSTSESATATPIESSSQAKSESKRMTLQPTIFSTFESKCKEKYKPNEQRKLHLDNLVLDMITTDLQPLSVVEDKGFRNLVHSLDPRYPIVSRKHLSQKLLPTKYYEEKTKLMISLNKTEFVSITTDQWTSKANDGYTTFTSHFIDDSWSIKTSVLSTRSEKKSHSAVNLAAEMTKCLEEYDLIQKVSAVVTDNAKNVTNSVAIAEAQDEVEGGHPCFAHTLNLVVKHSLEDDKATNRMIGKAKAIVHYFRSSTQANDELREVQKDNYRKLKQQCDTRWNSCHSMLISYQSQHKSICAVLAQRGRAHMCLNEGEFETLKQTVSILGVFLTATEEMSAEKYPSMSKVIPLVTMLKGIVGKNQAPLAKHLSRYIQSYFGQIETSMLLIKATFLDPRFKSKLFTDSNVEMTVEKEMKDEMGNIVAMTVDNQTEKTEKEVEEEEGTKKKSSLCTPAATKSQIKLWDEFDEEVEKERKAPAAKNAVEIEYDTYMSFERLRRKDDPLAWWRQHETHLPRLAKLAKKYLAVPATSVPSERVFSKAGQLVSARRANLNPKNVDMILFLNKH